MKVDPVAKLQITKNWVQRERVVVQVVQKIVQAQAAAAKIITQAKEAHKMK